MPKLPRLSAAAVVAALKRLGFEEVRQKGSHLVLRRTSINSDGSGAECFKKCSDDENTCKSGQTCLVVDGEPGCLG